MTDITVIILTGNEELHIGRCLEKLRDLNPRQVLVVESQKGDRTHEKAIEVAQQLQWQVKVEGVGQEQNLPTTTSSLNLIWHDWPGLQSTQFNWALDQLKNFSSVNLRPQPSSWILRLDADEYIDETSIAWLKANLDSIPQDVDALEFTLERKFMGEVIRHGTNGIKMVRMFRAGRGRYAETLMDERIVFEGKKLEVPVVFWDDNLNSLAWWKEKHRGYAKREAEQAIASLKTGQWVDPRKAKYYKMPRYLRAFIYFAIRYFLKGGILDGYGGWMWNFWQGLWYRCLVDREIGRMKDHINNTNV